MQRLGEARGRRHRHDVVGSGRDEWYPPPQPTRGFWGNVLGQRRKLSSPSGSEAEPQPPTIFTHFQDRLRTPVPVSPSEHTATNAKNVRKCPWGQYFRRTGLATPLMPALIQFHLQFFSTFLTCVRRLTHVYIAIGWTSGCFAVTQASVSRRHASLLAESLCRPPLPPARSFFTHNSSYYKHRNF